MIISIVCFFLGVLAGVFIMCLCGMCSEESRQREEAENDIDEFELDEDLKEVKESTEE